MTDRNQSLDWVTEAEALIRSLRSVNGVSIKTEGGLVEEINILADGERSPKNIVRDVCSALKAEFRIDIDYRKISIAQRRDTPVAEPVEPMEPARNGIIEILPIDESQETRLRFGGVTVSINQLRCQVQVELGLGSQEAVGEAHGPNSRDQVPRLISEATLKAVERFLSEDYLLTLGHIELLDMGSDTIVVVNVQLMTDRKKVALSGSCVVDHDLQQSVVYATLDSLNRILGRLNVKEPVEYELRPTSMI